MNSGPAQVDSTKAKGSTYHATLHFEDIHHMSLWRPDTGELLVVLHAEPPWHLTAHTPENRKHLLGWVKEGLVTIRGVEDAMAAYHAYVRENAAQLAYLVEDVLKHTATRPSVGAAANSPAAAPVAVPRGGWITLGRRKS